MYTSYENWLSNVTEEQKKELLAIKDNEQEIAERFGMTLNFGTAGMRGELGLGTFKMNEYTVRRATAGLSEYICSLGANAQKMGVVIAYDTRRMSREFAFAAAEVLSAYEIKVFIFEDVRPVPICSFAIRRLGTVAGIMITASHNPKEYNGFKVYGSDGAQMSPEATLKVVKYINELGYFDIKKENIETLYLNYSVEDVKDKDNLRLNNFVTIIGKSLDIPYYEEIEKLSLSPKAVRDYADKVKIVYTPVHGAGYLPIKTIFERLGIESVIVEEQITPDPDFSTVEVPNPENASTLKMGIELGKKEKADVILATDPDCDRLGAAVKNSYGEYVLLSGNQIGVLLLDYVLLRLKETKSLAKNAAAVKSIVSTTMADKIAEHYGVKMFNVLTGFKYIGEKIKEWETSKEYKYVFGFEESYGTLRGTHARDKDAVVGAMLFAEMTIYYASKKKTVYNRLLELFDTYGHYSEKNISVTYKGVSGMSDMAEVMKKLRNTKISGFGDEKVESVRDFLYENPSSEMLYFTLSDNQFVCIRPSGTEPKLKAYVLVCDKEDEKSAAKAEAILADIQKLI